MISDYTYDEDRKVNAPSRELYYYPNWDIIQEIRNTLREEKKRIWRNGSLKATVKSNAKDLLRPLYNNLVKKKHN